MGRRSRDKIGPYIPKIYARELREELKLTMTDVLERMAARGVVITEASLSRIERSIQPVDTPTLYAIAEALGASLTTMFTGIKPDPEGVDHILEWLDARDRATVRGLAENLAKAGAKPPTAKKSPPAKRRSRK